MNTQLKKYLLGALAIFALLGSIFINNDNSAMAASATTTCTNAVWSATLYGTVTPNGSSTEAWFEWGASPSLDYQTPHQTFNSDSSYSQNLTPLAENTTYYYQAVAQNQYGTARGSVNTFNTGTCSTPPQTCQDPSATNYGGSLPCKYATQTCQDPSATNYGGALPCKYPTQTCQDPSATNYGGALPCKYPVQTCQDPSATNYGGALPCKYPTQTCQDITAINYGGALPCKYNQQFPTVHLIANPSSVIYNGTSSLSWTSTNATSCTASGGTNGWAGSKSISGSFFTGPLTNTTNYYITCTNNSGSANDSQTIVVTSQQTCQDITAINYGGQLPCQYNNNQNQPTVSIYADDTNINTDESTTVRWSSSNANYCTATNGSNGWSGSRSTSGSFFTGGLSNDTTYRINCYNNNGSANDSVTVYVSNNNNNNRPTVSIYADKTYLNSNESTTVRWSSSNANYCTATSGSNGWSGSRNTSGSFFTGTLTYDTTYNINCYNNNGSANDSVTIRVNYNQPTAQIPTVVLTADQTSLSYNGATTVRWYTTNATSCYASGGSLAWAGTRDIGPGAFYTGSLTSSKTFSMTCTNQYGSSSDSVTVLVHGQVLGTTTYQGNALIILSSNVDRNQPIVATIDNTRPHPGDEINYTLTYQNIGTSTARNLVLRLDLPYEVDYMYSTPSNPTRSGQTLIWNLGNLGAGKSGTVSVRVRVRQDVPGGTVLNFPATLSYVDPSGSSQSVSANVSATVWNGDTILPNQNNNQNGNSTILGASVIGASFFPGSLFEWLLLLILILVLIVLIKYIFNQPSRQTIITH